MKKRIGKIGAVLLAVALFACLLAGCGTPSYTVTFDLNGGELVSGETEQTVEEGSAAQAPEVVNGGWSSPGIRIFPILRRIRW